MANSANKTPKETVPEETVPEVTAASSAEVTKDPEADWPEVYIPKGGDLNVYVGLNERNWLIPKGVPTKVPPEVKAALDRAELARRQQDQRINELRSDDSGAK